MFDAIVQDTLVLADSGVFGLQISGTYIGPGDLAPTGAIGWWGLRAFSSFTIGSRAINLRRDSDNATQDFVTLLNGQVDIPNILIFKGAANLFITTIYDQSGNGIPLAQATAVNQPPFILNVLRGFPALQNSGGTNLSLQRSSVITVPTPWCMSGVAQRTGNNTSFGTIVTANSDGIGLYFNNAANQVALFGAAALTASATDGNWHAVQGLNNGASSQVMVDGTTTSGTAGSTSIAFGGSFSIVGPNAASDNLTGNFFEAGMWAGDVSSKFASINNNQRAFWGF